MENFKEEEFKDLFDMEAVKEMVGFLDTVLDGEIYNVRITETDVTIDNNLKPVLPKGLENAKQVAMGKNKNMYAMILQIFIALIIDLNPIGTEDELDYYMRIAIITDAIAMGTVCRNKNWVESNTEFNANFVRGQGKELLKKHIKAVKNVQEMMNAAHNFLAFSSLNMVRFNHHFPNDKVNLISKSLLALSEDHRLRLLEEDKMYTFYNIYVTAARIVNDKLFYEKFLMKKKDDNNEYCYYPVLGIYNPNYEEEVINIRRNCTPNSFLILDIVQEIVNDLFSKKLMFLIPYQNQLATLISIRNHIRKNPFAYHPAKNFYKCKAEDFDKIFSLFQTTMREIGSFIFEYSDNMYESVRSAKCRNKYQKNIKKDDELLVKNILEISNVDISIDNSEKEMIKKKLYVSKYNVKEDTNMEEVLKKCYEDFNKLASGDILN